MPGGGNTHLVGCREVTWGDALEVLTPLHGQLLSLTRLERKAQLLRPHSVCSPRAGSHSVGCEALSKQRLSRFVTRGWQIEPSSDLLPFSKGKL